MNRQSFPSDPSTRGEFVQELYQLLGETDADWFGSYFGPTLYAIARRAERAFPQSPRLQAIMVWAVLETFLHSFTIH